MKNLIKILCLVLVLMLVVAPTTSFAASSISSFMSADDHDGGEIGDAVADLGGTVYSVFQTVAVVIGSCMVLYMAIQWILATPAKKAELKGRMISMGIGVILLFGGAAILAAIEKFASNISLVQ